MTHDWSVEQLVELFRAPTKDNTRGSHPDVGHWCGDIEHLHYPAPADIDKPINEAAAVKIRDYRADYNNRTLTFAGPSAN